MPTQHPCRYGFYFHLEMCKVLQYFYKYKSSCWKKWLYFPSTQLKFKKSLGWIEPWRQWICFLWCKWSYARLMHSPSRHLMGTDWLASTAPSITCRAFKACLEGAFWSSALVVQCLDFIQSFLHQVCKSFSFYLQIQNSRFLQHQNLLWQLCKTHRLA